MRRGRHGQRLSRYFQKRGQEFVMAAPGGKIALRDAEFRSPAANREKQQSQSQNQRRRGGHRQIHVGFSPRRAHRCRDVAIPRANGDDRAVSVLIRRHQTCSLHRRVCGADALLCRPSVAPGGGHIGARRWNGRCDARLRRVAAGFISSCWQPACFRRWSRQVVAVITETFGDEPRAERWLVAKVVAIFPFRDEPCMPKYNSHYFTAGVPNAALRAAAHVGVSPSRAGALGFVAAHLGVLAAGAACFASGTVSAHALHAACHYRYSSRRSKAWVVETELV
mmetsp:Transcript_101978/g.287870  ORF Transcript_101978/g.287870 Transcript_101978/m.287870 type:complete len:280 (-) Transcript_101978:209-1048(-)